ncbi:MAG: DUF1364 family protein [Gilliamella sp.]|nr:DUF1364 family protein [Gilliamella sp.]
MIFIALTLNFTLLCGLVGSGASSSILDLFDKKFKQYRLAGTCGVGMKPNDLQGAWACSACHDEIDRRTRVFEHDFVRLAHAEGIIRTQDMLIKEGKIKL